MERYCSLFGDKGTKQDLPTQRSEQSHSHQLGKAWPHKGKVRSEVSVTFHSLHRFPPNMKLTPAPYPSLSLPLSPLGMCSDWPSRSDFLSALISLLFP